MNGSSELKNQLEEIYTCYNRREFVHPDPLEFLYRYHHTADREIAGLVASGLAYGRVNQILKSTAVVLDELGSAPSEFLSGMELHDISELLTDFKHRFTAGTEIAAYLHAISTIQRDYGLVGSFFESLPGKLSYMEALDKFTEEVLFRMRYCHGEVCHLLPRPSRGSACKRLHLFMRWMVRKDTVDPGGWCMVGPSKLIVPVDVHMHRVGIRLGFTARKSADSVTALEITEGFRKVSPEDPVKYDFALTRYGIQGLTRCELFSGLLN